MNREQILVMLSEWSFQDIMDEINGKKGRPPQKLRNGVATAEQVLRRLGEDGRRDIAEMMRRPNKPGAFLTRGHRRIRGNLVNKAMRLVFDDEDAAVDFLKYAIATPEERKQAWNNVVQGNDTRALPSSGLSPFQADVLDAIRRADWERLVVLLRTEGIRAKPEGARHLLVATKNQEVSFVVEVDDKANPERVEMILGASERVDVPTDVGSLLRSLPRS